MLIKKIALLSGGDSEERDISIKSGLAVYQALKNLNYEVSLIDPKNTNLCSLVNYDAAFICLHGKNGEDGIAQTYFEYLKIPYTHSGVISSHNAMNKIISKKIFIKNKIKANKITRKVLDHAVIFIKKCIKENFYLPMRFKTSLYRIFDCEKFEISRYEKEFFFYFKNALSKTHQYSIYKQSNK